MSDPEVGSEDFSGIVASALVDVAQAADHWSKTTLETTTLSTDKIYPRGINVAHVWFTYFSTVAIETRASTHPRSGPGRRRIDTGQTSLVTLDVGSYDAVAA